MALIDVFLTSSLDFIESRSILLMSGWVCCGPVTLSGTT